LEDDPIGSIMVNIRKLVAVDMLLHGARFIIAEFAFGIILGLALGVMTIRNGVIGLALFNWAIGIWLIGSSANYIPLLIYAILIARAGTIKVEGQPELANKKRYNIQQFIVLIPFVVVVIALEQERYRTG
jgi:hypothetical protein